MQKVREYSIRQNPIMQELWAVKAKINADANYSVAEIARRMREKYPRVQTTADPAVGASLPQK
jgi:hypothetical protein